MKLTLPASATAEAAPIGLEQYYEEAWPDYAAWSEAFNMHFGYFRRGAHLFAREAMLEQMNAEVLARLSVEPIAAPRLLDLGCGLGATMRSIARRRSTQQSPASRVCLGRLKGRQSTTLLPDAATGSACWKVITKTPFCRAAVPALTDSCR